MNEKRLEFLLLMLAKVPDDNKVKFFQEIGFIGKMADLRTILPLKKYSEDKVKKAAQAASIKIILKTFKEDEVIASLDIEVFKKLLDNFNQNHDTLTESDFGNLEYIEEKILRIAGLPIKKTIPVEIAKSDMVVIKPVLNATGTVILGKGTTLNEDILQRLKQQDIYRITVEMAPDVEVEIPPIVTEMDESTENIVNELNHRFEGLEHNPAMNIIKESALRFLVGQQGNNSE